MLDTEQNNANSNEWMLQELICRSYTIEHNLKKLDENILLESVQIFFQNSLITFTVQSYINPCLEVKPTFAKLSCNNVRGVGWIGSWW